MLDKVKSPTEREWYIQQTVQQGWSRDVLVHQIESGLYRRQGAAITNFDRVLTSPQSDLAHALLKDPYNFDFLSMGTAAQERDLERGLLMICSAIPTITPASASSSANRAINWSPNTRSAT